MKKLLGIIVLGLLLSGNAYAEVYEMLNCKPNGKKLLEAWGPADVRIDTSNKSITWSGVGGSEIASYTYDSGNSKTGFKYVIRPFWHDDKNTGDKQSYVEYTYSLSTAKVIAKIYTKTVWQKKVKYNDYHSSERTHNCDRSNLPTNNESQSAGISFTIKDKKEQCAAIGFKPATDKFADCVLRLVELDLKKQINNPTIVAQDSGNQAIVEELKRNNNMQQSQFLMNLSNQLLNPSSPASSMSSSSCTVRGGTIKTINCW